MTDPNVAPPLFSAAHGDAAPAPVVSRNNPNLNLDDIFGDVVFTPDGDTVFLSEQAGGDVLNSGEGDNVKSMASKPDGTGHFHSVNRAGGVQTTQLEEYGKPSLQMGTGGGGQPAKAVPFRHKPQAGHQLQYAVPKKSRGKMTDAQKNERRYVYAGVVVVVLCVFSISRVRVILRK